MEAVEIAPVGRHLLDASKRYPERTFLQHSDGSRITYGEAAWRVGATLELFDELGIAAGDRVVCYSDQKIEPALFFLSCAASGVLFVPLHPVFSHRYLARLAAQVEAKRVFTTRDLVQGVVATGLRAITYDDPGEGRDVVELAALPDAQGPDRIEHATRTVGLEDLAVIQLTSGSTGHSKLVLRKQMSIARYPRYFAPLVTPHGPEPQRRLLHVQSLSTTGGLNWLTIGVSRAAEILVTTVTDKDASIHEVLAHEPEVMWVTPRILTGLRRSFEATFGPITADSRLFGPRAETLLIGGARPDIPFLETLEAGGIAVHDFYGSTEGSLIALTPRDGRRWKDGWTGQLLDDTSMRTDDDGELLLHNPGLMLGYLHDEELTRQAMTEDGFFRTGDRGEVDEERYIRIQGRKKDLFNTPIGTYIDPRYIEGRLEELPGVDQAFLFGHNLPHITAYLAVAYPETGPVDPLGHLDPELHRDPYERLRRRIAELNRELESIERIAAFMLFDRLFPEEVYQELPAKVRRNRAAFEVRYEDRIHALYPEQGLPPDHPCRVDLP